jgi:predicted ABC-type ATPase
MSPRMFIVAGPPGGGKSSVFSRSVSGIDDVFNADDRAAELNGGSYRRIPPEIRAATNREFEKFIHSHIRAHKDFAFETTLRTPITFEQAALAHMDGFEVTMAFVALRTPEMHIERVIGRAGKGGHSAPPEKIREIYTASMKNLPRALAELDDIRVYDNSSITGKGPQLILRILDRHPVYLIDEPPDWLTNALRNTDYRLDRIRRQLDRGLSS